MLNECDRASENERTFSDTKMLPPFRSSGAIQGSVPRTPPEIKVWHFTFERPRSATCREAEVKIESQVSCESSSREVPLEGKKWMITCKLFLAHA